MVGRMGGSSLHGISVDRMEHRPHRDPWSRDGRSGDGGAVGQAALSRTNRRRQGAGYRSRTWRPILAGNLYPRCRWDCLCDPCSTSQRAGEETLPEADEMTRKPAAKPYWEMTTPELAEATAEFDKEFVA